MPIRNVSDTARWVAFYRAMESERPDALFVDPYARLLAGAEGEEAVRTIPKGRQSAWAMIVRTAVLDEIILRLVREDGVDRVLNLAAGLDTRPFRLDLPPSLDWVEIDLPGILEFKRERMEGERPACRLESIAADLSDADDRRTSLDEALRGARSALVVTEGLLIYLEDEQVAGLARDLHARSACRWWLTDLASPWLLKFMHRSYKRGMDASVQFRFAPEEGPDWFRRFGWEPEEYRSSLEEAKRLDREMRGAWMIHLSERFSRRIRERNRRISGFLLLGRDGRS